MMDFNFSDDQIALRESVAKALTQTYSFMGARERSRRGEDVPELWATLADLGVLALPFSMEQGGLGGTLGDLVAVAEVLGEHLVVAPYLSSAILAGHLLAVADGGRAGGLIAEVITGDVVAALACGTGVAGPPTCRAERIDGGPVLSGEYRLVLGGGQADVLLVAVEDPASGRVQVARVPMTGISRRAYLTIDGRAAADIRLEAVRIDDGDVLIADAADALAQARLRATLAACAESIGAMGALLNATGAYASTRQQFGSPIGRFQAIATALRT